MLSFTDKRYSCKSKFYQYPSYAYDMKIDFNEFLNEIFINCIVKIPQMWVVDHEYNMIMFWVTF